MSHKMKFLCTFVTLLCINVVAAKFRIDGGVEANFNEWPFACRVKYRKVITGPLFTTTCVLIQFGQKFYAISVGHLLGKTLPNTTDEFIQNNLRISYPKYASIVSGVVSIDSGSAQNHTLSRATINIDENTLKLPLQYVETLRDITKQGFAYDFLTIQIHNHQWFKQRYAKFLDISNYTFDALQPLIQCKIAGWGEKNGNLSASLQQTEVHMIPKDRCEFYFNTLASRYKNCIRFSLIGDPVCFGISPNARKRAGDSGAPLMCKQNGKSVMVAINVGTLPNPIGGRNISISAGAPLATIKAFLELIN